MLSEEYAEREAEGRALADRVEAHGVDAGRGFVVGMTASRNAPRFTVTERGHGKVPLASWSPSWDGWLEKAERDCRVVGLLPNKEDEMPVASAEEKARGAVLREKLDPLLEAAGSPKTLARAAVELMAESGAEPFGGAGAATPPHQIAEIQLAKFMDRANPSELLSRNLDKWEPLLPDLEARFLKGRSQPEQAEAEEPPAATTSTLGEMLGAGADPKVLQETREALAARDDDLAAEKERVRELEAQVAERAEHVSEVVQLERQRRVEVEKRMKEIEDELDAVRAEQQTQPVEADVRPSTEVVAARVPDDSPMLVRDEPYEERYPGGYGPARVILSHEQPDAISHEVRRRYGDTLLRMLERNEPGIEAVEVMRRLDVIADLPGVPGEA